VVIVDSPSAAVFWDKNIRLIVALRNHASGLIALARAGFAALKTP
jgi:hypothetical protein